MVEKVRPTIKEREKVIGEFVEDYFIVGNEASIFLKRPDLVLTDGEREMLGLVEVLGKLESLLVKENIKEIEETDKSESVEVVDSLRDRLELSEVYISAEDKRNRLFNLLKNG